jgi:hypothetical protein
VKRYRVRKVEQGGSILWTDLQNDTLAVPCQFTFCKGVAGMRFVLIYYAGDKRLRTRHYLCYGHADEHRRRIEVSSKLRNSVCAASGCVNRARWLVFTDRDPSRCWHLCEIHAAAETNAVFELPLSWTSEAYTAT